MGEKGREGREEERRQKRREEEEKGRREKGREGGEGGEEERGGEKRKEEERGRGREKCHRRQCIINMARRNSKYLGNTLGKRPGQQLEKQIRADHPVIVEAK